MYHLLSCPATMTSLNGEAIVEFAGRLCRLVPAAQAASFHPDKGWYETVARVDEAGAVALIRHTASGMDEGHALVASPFTAQAASLLASL